MIYRAATFFIVLLATIYFCWSALKRDNVYEMPIFLSLTFFVIIYNMFKFFNKTYENEELRWKRLIILTTMILSVAVQILIVYYYKSVHKVYSFKIFIVLGIDANVRSAYQNQ